MVRQDIMNQTNSQLQMAQQPSASSQPQASQQPQPTVKPRKVNLTVDGRAVSAPETMTILAAAKKAGVNIPTLCFYWGLNDIGSCRVCVVEVEGHEQLVTAWWSRPTRPRCAGRAGPMSS